MEVQYEGYEAGRVLGVGYNSDFVFDSTVCVRTRGMVFCRASRSIAGSCGMEEVLGILIDSKESSQLNFSAKKQSSVHSREHLCATAPT